MSKRPALLCLSSPPPSRLVRTVSGSLWPLPFWCPCPGYCRLRLKALGKLCQLPREILTPNHKCTFSILPLQMGNPNAGLLSVHRRHQRWQAKSQTTTQRSPVQRTFQKDNHFLTAGGALDHKILSSFFRITWYDHTNEKSTKGDLETTQICFLG